MSANQLVKSEAAIQLFKFESREVRVVMRDGEPWWVAKDVADAMGYGEESHTSMLFKHVPDEWKGGNPISTLGGMQNMTVISEQGLYFFLGRSEKPAALPLQKWVAGEVLPSIRKHGAYMTIPTIEAIIANPDIIIELAMQLKKEREEKEILEIALDLSQKFVSVRKYNITHKMGWNLEQCKKVGKALSAYCRSHRIEVKRIKDELFGEVNGYLVAAWETFMAGVEDDAEYSQFVSQPDVLDRGGEDMR